MNSGQCKKKKMQEKRARKKAEEEDPTLKTERLREQQKNKNKIIAAQNGRKPQEKQQPKQPQTENKRNKYMQPRQIHDLITVFAPEDKEIFKQRIDDAQKPLKMAKPDWQFTDGGAGINSKDIELPCRPKWTLKTNKQQLEQQECDYIEDYINQIYEKYGSENLNHFEHNLEVWRQLWRVCEKSDIILFVVDARNPLFYFNDSLFQYITVKNHKPLIIVLTKFDLVDDSVLEEWRFYFKHRYNVPVVLFSSLPKDIYKAEGMGVNMRMKMYKGRRTTQASGIQELWRTISQQKICKFDENQEKKEIEAFGFFENTDLIDNKQIDNEESDEEDEEAEDDEEEEEENVEEDLQGHVSFQSKKLTIGTVGSPNVGKSSLINGLFGKKVVRASKTPGKTKHFQTINVRQNVQLCDCPGLVFPRAYSSRSLQVLFGIIMVSTLREPYSSFRFLCERIDLVKLFHLDPPFDEIDLKKWDGVWTPFMVTEALAIKKGYITAKTGRPDTYKAASQILTDTFLGRIVLYFRPKFSEKEKKEMKELQQIMQQLRIKDQEIQGKEQDGEQEEEEKQEEEEEEKEEQKPKIVQKKNMFMAFEDDSSEEEQD